MLSVRHNEMNCKKCNKSMDKLEAFPGDICVECYEAVYEGMSEEEKVPNFTSTLNITK